MLPLNELILDAYLLSFVKVSGNLLQNSLTLIIDPIPDLSRLPVFLHVVATIVEVFHLVDKRVEVLPKPVGDKSKLLPFAQ